MARIKKDKTTGMPVLPEGWFFEVYQAVDDGIGANLGQLRIRVVTDILDLSDPDDKESKVSYSRIVNGYAPPEYVTKGDIYRAAKGILQHVQFELSRKNYVSPFIGKYPPKSLNS